MGRMRAITRASELEKIFRQSVGPSARSGLVGDTMPKKTTSGPLAFVDTNIFLDFYRLNNEATLTLLGHLKTVKARIISTYQVEMEFLKNRQSVLIGTMNEVKAVGSPPLPAIFADTATSASMKTLTKAVGKKTNLLRKRLDKLLKNPKQHDVVYQALTDIFQSPSAHVLRRDTPNKATIKRLAWRRFMLGYPPRKDKDTSIGDALNWEWIVHCGTTMSGDIIIVSRDGDYGAELKSQYFLNDELRHEYSERVGKRRKLIYTRRLSEALKQLNVSVSKKEIDAESAAIDQRTHEGGFTVKQLASWFDAVKEFDATPNAD
jgi:hypothetical protein